MGNSTADQVPPGTQTVGTKPVPDSKTQARPVVPVQPGMTPMQPIPVGTRSVRYSKTESRKTSNKAGCCSYMSKFWSWTRWGLGWALYPFSFCCGSKQQPLDPEFAAQVDHNRRQMDHNRRQF